ncbi:ras guanine nucleotide exchange factor domain-containing protein [Cladochytrium replicatum]|nr:ras guanine nucleotide exchange factor domain-containing protein [Cladochytrium replicatum]
MLAAWVKKPALVKLLVSRGAICDSEAAERIKNGILFFNRLRMEWNVWLSKSSATKDISLVQTGGSLKAMLLYLTTEDTELIGTILGILQSKSQEEVEQVAESGNKEAHTVTFKVAEVSDAVQDDAAAAKARRRTSKRASSYRQGINFEKLIGNNPDILELTDQIPSSGTELDEICVSVFECVVQLMLAANKNVKHQYVTIAAKAVHHTTDLLRAIEVLEKSAGKPLTIAATPASALSTTSTLMPPASAALIASAGITQSPSWSRVRADNDITFISSSPVRERISEVARVLNLEHSRQLMVTTRISVGVWPPANAISDMIKAAATLAKACRSLAQLANSTGFFPILGHKLEMRFELFDQFGEPAQESGKLDGGDRRVNKASFTNFKRQHQLKLIEEASKSYAQGSSSDGPSAALSNDSLEAEEASTEFSNALDNLVRQFVASVSELKRVQMMHLTEEYVFVTSTVNARADAIIQEVRSYEPFSDIPDTITLEPADARLLTKAGVRLSPELILPAPINLPLSSATTELEAAADLVMFRGKVASGPWPPPSSSSEMLQSTIPCVMAVKMLMNLAKMAAVKIKTTASEERVKREQWKKDCLQNEKVKKLFQIWEDQFRTDSDVTMTDGSLTEEDAAILEESTEGLVLEESHATNKKVVKGGRLQQLIERATSPSNDDAEYLPILISTHHSFTTSLELLTMLIKRYSVTPQYGLNQRQFDLVLNKKVVPIRLGVCHFLKLWISNHFEEDFAQNEALVLRFRDFVQRKVAHDFEAFSVELLQTLDNKLEGIEAASVVQTPARSPLPTNTSFLSVPSTPPPSSSPLIASLTFQKRAQTTDLASLLNSDPAYFFEIDPYEMARQLTAMEFTYFTGVKPYECTDQIWGERRQKELKWAPTGKETGIARMIRHTNQLTNWVASNIVSCETLKARVSALKYFMQLALGCREVNNFNGITGVVAGLSMAPVTRLKKTWQALSEKFQKIHDAYTEVADTVSPKAQYANYRRALKDLKPPLIPFLGVYLTDLTFIELGNPSFLPDTLFINFEKRRKVYATIKQIRMHQQTAYSISAVAAIQDFLRSVDGVNASQKEVLLTEDELYEQSLIVEPREDESESDSHDDD